GAEKVPGTIDMGLKKRAFFFDFSGTGKRKDLIASAVRKNRLIPSVETMQALCFLQDLQAGPEIQVVGIAQNDLRLDVLLQLFLRDSLYAPRSAYRHKNGRFHRPMVGVEYSGPCSGFLILGNQFKTHPEAYRFRQRNYALISNVILLIKITFVDHHLR